MSTPSTALPTALHPATSTLVDADAESKADALRRERAERAHQQIETQFRYHTPSPQQVLDMQTLRDKARDLGHAIVAYCPDSADRSAAIRLLREAVMTANASIVLGGR